MDALCDKLSIKNLLFTKVIPNYIVTTANEHRVYGCTDCGDKFYFETSYNDHINRQSALISYMCRHCSKSKIFYNRCNLLSHIRSHAFKTATINVADLKVDSLPVSHYKTKTPLPSTSAKAKPTVKPSASPITCNECKENITITGIAYKDRASHFMPYTNEVLACPVCLFALPSVCAFKLHLRVHLKCPPYICPECGLNLFNKNVQYPYNHDCEGFKMMRATARLMCTVPSCSLFHPNESKQHMTKYHLKTVYKCPHCVVACFSESTMEKHLQGHTSYVKPLTFYQCELCPGRYVLQNTKFHDQHLDSHVNSHVFPCWACGTAFKDVSNLLTHFLEKHNKSDVINSAVKEIINDSSGKDPQNKTKTVYRVVKRCEQCKRSFTYKCKYGDIQVLPKECPFQCTSTTESDVTHELSETDTNDQIKCPLCLEKIPQLWDEIKKHYFELHNTHKCLDAEVLLTRIDIKKYLHRRKRGRPKSKKTLQKVSKRKLSRSSTSPITVSESQSLSPSTPNDKDEVYVCNMCGDRYEQKSILEEHMLSHRDLCMAYQCMECGQSFVVKPSFSKHLLLKHNITDIEDYIKNKQCYNEIALNRHQNTIETTNDPLRENQCSICREEFNGPEDLEKHFRTHGMAFLIKNTSNKNNVVL